MRIVMIATGSRGDVEPYIALGVGLRAAGYEVRVLTHEDLAPLASARGLEAWPIQVRAQDIAQSADMSRLLEQGNFLRVLAQMARDAKEGATTLARAGMDACRDADLLLAGLAGIFTTHALAEKHDLPLIQAYYIPLTPTSDYPSFVLPRSLPIATGAVNRLSYRITQQMLWQAFQPADRQSRARVLSLPPAPFRGPFDSERMRRAPVLYGYSPAVIPPPPDWEGRAIVTGYWMAAPDDAWEPPSDLASFLAGGDPPVYIGFGSMSSRHPEQTAELVLGALAGTGRRGIILSGWGGMTTTTVPDSVYVLTGAPFGWLFPRMAAVVHHGGAGTTAEGLRAGVPSVVVPFFGDQPYWGRRVAALGVGPNPIQRKRLTIDRLAAAIDQACSDEAMRQRAAALGARIRAEDGVARAVKVIEGLYPIL